MYIIFQEKGVFIYINNSPPKNRNKKWGPLEMQMICLAFSIKSQLYLREMKKKKGGGEREREKN